MHASVAHIWAMRSARVACRDEDLETHRTERTEKASSDGSTEHTRRTRATAESTFRGHAPARWRALRGVGGTLTVHVHSRRARARWFDQRRSAQLLLAGKVAANLSSRR
jgi:hypothetical protein